MPFPLPPSLLIPAQRQQLARNFVTTVFGLTLDGVKNTISEVYRGYPFVNFTKSVKTKVFKARSVRNSVIVYI